MRNYEDILSLGNMDLKGMVIEESTNSSFVTAKRKIYVPEKKIVLMDQMTEQEYQLLMNTAKYKGGIIV